LHIAFIDSTPASVLNIAAACIFERRAPSDDEWEALKPWIVTWRAQPTTRLDENNRYVTE
jgi:hypothetical protein